MDGGHGAHLIVLRGPNLGALHRLEGTEVVVGGDPFRAGVGGVGRPEPSRGARSNGARRR